MKKTYTCDPDVKWVVENDGINLIHHRKEESLFLGYPEAAVWDFVTQNFSYKRMTHLLSHILLTSEEKAGLIIKKSLANWSAKQYLINVAFDG